MHGVHYRFDHGRRQHGRVSSPEAIGCEVPLYLGKAYLIRRRGFAKSEISRAITRGGTACSTNKKDRRGRMTNGEAAVDLGNPSTDPEVDEEPMIFISHKQTDEVLAKKLGRWIAEVTGGHVRVFPPLMPARKGLRSARISTPSWARICGARASFCFCTPTRTMTGRTVRGNAALRCTPSRVTRRSSACSAWIAGPESRKTRFGSLSAMRRA